MKKFLAIAMLFCLTLNSFAATGSLSSIETLMDEYQYTMTVDWDQKDQVFYESETKKFFEEMTHIMMVEGATAADIQAIMQKKIQNKQALDALNTRFLLLGSTPAMSEIVSTIKDHQQNFYATGASWEGSSPLKVAGIVAAVALFGFAIWFGVNYECKEYEYAWGCTDPGQPRCVQGQTCSRYGTK